MSGNYQNKITAIIFCYLIICTIFKVFDDVNVRTVASFCLFFYYAKHFNLKHTTILQYIFLAILASATEIIFITQFNDTWIYKKPDILHIPYWLIPLWAIAVLMISTLTKDK